jgi:hypothetical protein
MIYGSTESLVDEVQKEYESIRRGIFRSAVMVVAAEFY